MSYITSFEEIGIEKGRISGLQDGIALALRIKFGEASGAVVDEIRQIADLATLEAVMPTSKRRHPSMPYVSSTPAGSHRSLGCWRDPSSYNYVLQMGTGCCPFGTDPLPSGHWNRISETSERLTHQEGHS